MVSYITHFVVSLHTVLPYAYFSHMAPQSYFEGFGTPRLNKFLAAVEQNPRMLEKNVRQARLLKVAKDPGSLKHWNRGSDKGLALKGSCKGLWRCLA